MTNDITTKADLIDRIERAHADLVAAIDGLSDEQMRQPGVVGDWSVKDMLAHVTAWEQEMLGWYRAGQRGDTPKRPASDTIDAFNHALYQRHRDRDLADVRAAFDASYREVLAAVRAMSEAEIFTVGHYGWTGDYPLLVYIRANTDEHYAEHAAEIRAWRD